MRDDQNRLAEHGMAQIHQAHKRGRAGIAATGAGFRIEPPAERGETRHDGEITLAHKLASIIVIHFANLFLQPRRVIHAGHRVVTELTVAVQAQHDGKSLRARCLGTQHVERQGGRAVRLQQQFLTRVVREFARRKRPHLPLFRRRVWADQPAQFRAELPLPRRQFRWSGTAELQLQRRGVERKENFLVHRGQLT